ncbi:hypothetical protein PEBR_06711 [Penicillium brasilianum]|uniref:Uncharacterized protein n=1 Tax=Penicillium brasilianum TaxID=104259 RepID=A0A1S9RWA8_PENBI|nr:hypothetical protein PEBR_06711 [Penicillium brasilianum]
MELNVGKEYFPAEEGRTEVHLEGLPMAYLRYHKKQQKLETKSPRSSKNTPSRCSRMKSNIIATQQYAHGQAQSEIIKSEHKHSVTLMDKDTRILIRGAGCFGTSTEYHLARRGNTSIGVIEPISPARL